METIDEQKTSFQGHDLRIWRPTALSPKTDDDHRIINKIRQALTEGRPFYSFEFFPPKTDAGVRNLYSRVDRMSMLGPMFLDVTWGAGGSTADLTLEISINANNYCSSEVMMHLTCTNMSIEMIDNALETCKKNGIRNILALRGDPPKGQEQWEQCEGGFAHAIDLVRYIRKKYNDWFSIAVAGYPEGHMTAATLDEDIKHLKEKVDAGADFIITQLFYDVDLFLDYVKRCKAVGVTVPIIPGIMPIQNYRGFVRMTTFCKTRVPDSITKALEPIKDDDAAVKRYGVQLAIEMCKKLLTNGILGIHFYTLNLEKSVTQILAGLGFLQKDVKKGTTWPWVPSKLNHRKDEEVRPIFWANRPNSYMTRTHTWDEFPNGRWGDSASPAFGELDDYHLFSFKMGTKAERRMIWGEKLQSSEDVYNVFHEYVQGRVLRLPWCETPLHLETLPMKQKLAAINKAGYLTINSQPRVNGAESDDSAVGWGGPGGYVYQKAYLELFASPELTRKLLAELDKMKSMTYQAINKAGDSLTNVRTEKGVNAVTWGVFPDKEIIQPTVVDPLVFRVWKDEAFALWLSQWQSAYAEDKASRAVIQDVHDTFYLINIVDNDYIKGDIFKAFDNLVEYPEAATEASN